MKNRAAAKVVLLVAVLTAVLLGSGVAGPAEATAGHARSAGPAVRVVAPEPVQAFSVPYITWNGQRRCATVLLPLDYVPGDDAEALPCIIQSPGRRATPAVAASTWRDLPSTRHFMVIVADQAGRRDPLNSWGVAGQIHDLLRMPQIVEGGLPGVHVDQQRQYAVGVSMGGQEALLALAFHPEHWAAVLCVDGVADLAARYREFALVDRLDVRPLMRKEVGGSPRRAPFQYAVRSPITFVRTLAASDVPLAIWWSADDQLVVHQETTQTGHLYSRILALDPAAPVVQRIGTGSHGLMIRQDPGLAIDFLCPGGEWLCRPSPPARWEYSGWQPSSGAWGYSFSTVPGLEQCWRVAVDGDRLTVRTPGPITIRVPYGDERPAPAVVRVNRKVRSVEPRRGMLRVALRRGVNTVVVDP